MQLKGGIKQSRVVFLRVISADGKKDESIWLKIVLSAVTIDAIARRGGAGVPE